MPGVLPALRVPLLVLSPLVALPLASAGLFGNNLGVGLGDCAARHPLLLSQWTFNATTATVRRRHPDETVATAAEGWQTMKGHACNIGKAPLFDTTASSDAECQELCQNHAGCVEWQLGISGKICWGYAFRNSPGANKGFDCGCKGSCGGSGPSPNPPPPSPSPPALPDWCLSIDNTLSNLPPTDATGASVFLAPCNPWSLGRNLSQQAQSFAFRGGRLESLYAGQPTGDKPTASVQGLCLHSSTETGVLDMQPCASSSSWQIDPGTGQISPLVFAGAPAAERRCLVAINTTSDVVDPWTQSTVNCSTAPGSLLPFCNAKAPLEDRIKNFLSFVYMSEMPTGFGRLGMPRQMPTGECLHGFVSDCLDNETCPTIFPDALASASSFNDTLFEAIGRQISIEGRAVDNVAAPGPKDVHGQYSGPLKPHSICWSPDLNPFRHPLWGRGQEVPSEGYVLGLQGNDDPEGQGYLRLVASPKHFVGYDTEGMGPVSSGCVGAGTGQPGTGCTFSGPTFNRHNFTANITAQELVEYYALPFKHAVVDGGAMGLMCSYNALDITVNSTDGGTKRTGSIPACAFTALQDGMVRGQWNFSGHIVSDCGAIADFMVDNKCSGCGEVLPTHGLCHDAKESSKCPSCSSQCLAASMYRGGTDSSCGASGDSNAALRAGTLTKAELIASSLHSLRVLFALGLANSEEEQPYRQLGKADIGSEASRQLNLEAARQSIVLLHLFSASLDTVTVLDSNREGCAQVLLKNEKVGDKPVLPLTSGMTLAVLGQLASQTGGLLSNYHPPAPPTGSKYEITTPADALAAAGFNVTVEYGAAVNLHGNPPDNVGMAKAVAVANASDAAVIFVGLNTGEEHESGDRNATGAGLALPGNQQALVDAVLQVNPNTIVVLIHGSPISMEHDRIPALIDMHYPGAMGGLAIADVLSGSFNPCGRLTTMVYPRAFVNRSIFDMGLRSDGGLTYQHYDGTYGEPLWSFGDGISYSDIAVKAHATPPASVATAALAHGTLTFAVEVTNAAGPAACHSVLGFISSDHPEAPRNHKLFDFARVNLQPHESSIATVRLSADTAALVKGDGSKWLLPGNFRIEVGSMNATLQLTGQPIMVEPPPPLFSS